LKKIIFILIIFFTSIFLPVYLENKSRIYIGVMSTLSGENSDFGRSVLNGIIMGTEEFNRNRNFYRKKMNLIVKDDKNDIQEATRCANELIDEGVVAILGPSLSQIELAISKVGNNRKKLIISNALGTKKLLNKDDYLIHMAPYMNKNAEFLAEVSKNYLNMNKILIIYSETNLAYTEDFKDKYIEKFTLGSESENTIYIKKTLDKINTYFPSIKDDIDGVLIIGNPIETAYVIQKIKKIKKDTKILISDRAYNKDLIIYGGKFTEGVYTAVFYDDIYLDEESSRSNKKFADFKKRYIEKYGKDPDIGAIYGYESFNILAYTIKKNKDIDSKSLKKEILSPESGKYFLQPGRFNKYGDSERNIFIFQVKDKRFQEIKL